MGVPISAITSIIGTGNLMPGTGGLGLAGGTTAQRFLATPGVIRVNYDTNVLEITFDGFTYIPIGGGAANLGNFFFSGNTVITTNANGNMNFAPNGMGQFTVTAPFNIQGGNPLQIYNAGGNYNRILSQAGLAQNNTWYLPNADASVSGQPITSNAGGILSFGTLTVPGGGTGIATTTAYGVICGGTTATGNFQNAGAGIGGQVLTSGGPAGLPAYTTIYGSAYINQAATPVTLGFNIIYGANTAGLLTFNMPAAVPIGTIIEIIGVGAGGWLVQLNAGQVAHSNATATSGGGTLSSTNQFNSVKLICIAANTTFNAIINGAVNLA